ncbi:MAG: hypothetical protein WKF77_23900 [Planctomycetaceae bacterium]
MKCITDQGDLKIQITLRHPQNIGYGYGIAVIERSVLKTIKGKPILPD